MTSTSVPFRAESYQPMAFTKRTRPTKKSERRMPICRYGSHCSMPRCIYEHHTDAAASSSSPTTTTKQTVCIHFLSDACDFGDACWNHHPATVGERQAILRVLARQPCTNQKPCPYGDACLFRCDPSGSPASSSSS